MGSKHEESVSGPFQYLIFSPKGAIEGVLLGAEREPVQIVFGRHDEGSSADFDVLRRGQQVVVKATRQAPSKKGESEHTVFGYVRLVSVDGRKPVKRKAAKAPAFTGVVNRFNYARHGAANGVVLDTGDFVHTKPEGLAALHLKVGDKVIADGEAHQLADGSGRVVEAITVNGKRVKKA